MLFCVDVVQARQFIMTRRCPSDSVEKLSVAGAQVDLNPHQVEAALFAFNIVRFGSVLDTHIYRTLFATALKNSFNSPSDSGSRWASLSLVAFSEPTSFNASLS